MREKNKRCQIHTCDPSTWEAEAGGLWSQDQAGLLSKICAQPVWGKEGTNGKSRWFKIFIWVKIVSTKLWFECKILLCVWALGSQLLLWFLEGCQNSGMWKTQTSQSQDLKVILSCSSLISCSVTWETSSHSLLADMGCFPQASTAMMVNPFGTVDQNKPFPLHWVCWVFYHNKEK